MINELRHFCLEGVSIKQVLFPPWLVYTLWQNLDFCSKNQVLNIPIFGVKIQIQSGVDFIKIEILDKNWDFASVCGRETVGSWSWLLRGKSMAKHSRTSCAHNSIISEQNDDASFNKGSHEFRSCFLPQMEIHLMKTLDLLLCTRKLKCKSEADYYSFSPFYGFSVNFQR